MFLTSLVTLWLALHQSTAPTQDVGPKQVGDIALRLQCGALSGIRFTLANMGIVDTTLLIGDNLGNGSKYMISDLKLAVQVSGQTTETYHYSPYDYPSGIAGRRDDWLQPLPARSEFALTAKPEDFLSSSRPKSFQKGSELTLTLVVPPPRPQALMLRYWAGTLRSNTCVMD